MAVPDILTSALEHCHHSEAEIHRHVGKEAHQHFGTKSHVVVVEINECVRDVVGEEPNQDAQCSGQGSYEAKRKPI